LGLHTFYIVSTGHWRNIKLSIECLRTLKERRILWLNINGSKGSILKSEELRLRLQFDSDQKKSSQILCQTLDWSQLKLKLSWVDLETQAKILIQVYLLILIWNWTIGRLWESRCNNLCSQATYIDISLNQISRI